jgi:DNA repair photolyase
MPEARREKMDVLKLFHKDILTVRSHQWKYFIEPYSGCAFQCTYCLHWETDAYVKHLYPPDDLIPRFEDDLARMKKKQIVYIGATIDPYQLLERKTQITRQILARLLEREIPVVILTKSPLILRDLDLLMELQRRELVMIQFTVLTTNERKSRLLERAAPSVRERLDAASRLASHGIPVHYHVSPVIPDIYEGSELADTVQAIADSGGQVIYSNILGMRYRNTGVFLSSMEAISPGVTTRLLTAYGENENTHKKVFSPDTDLIYGAMSEIRDKCIQSRIDFICEFMPDLDAFNPQRFGQGMFRHGLPTVYQMAHLFDDAAPKTWNWFQAELKRRFPALDEEYEDLVRGFWDDGQLFANTRIDGEVVNGEHVYHKVDQAVYAHSSVMAWD